METKKFREKLGNLITRAHTEIDELRVKIALGKMNGADLFEEMKKELRESFHEIPSEVKKKVRKPLTAVKSRIEALQVQLALGKAEALDAYEDQKRKINGY
jgi:signal transduction histidine kinase